MSRNYFIDMKNDILHLTFPQIEQRIALNPAIILPVAGIEPVGNFCRLGAVETIIKALGNTISESGDILCAPVLSYSFTMPYRAFPGSIGIRKNIFESMLAGFIKDCIQWGIKFIYILDGSYNSHYSITGCIANFKKKNYPVRIILLNWQYDPEIKSYIAAKYADNGFGRNELCILDLISYIDAPFICNERIPDQKKISADRKKYQQWSKRGKDPDKFRNLFPECSTTLIGKDTKISAESGKELFDYIVKRFIGILADDKNHNCV